MWQTQVSAQNRGANLGHWATLKWEGSNERFEVLPFNRLRWIVLGASPPASPPHHSCRAGNLAPSPARFRRLGNWLAAVRARTRLRSDTGAHSAQLAITLRDCLVSNQFQDA